MDDQNESSNTAILRHRRHFDAIDSIRVPSVAKVVCILLVVLIGGAVAFMYFVPWIQTTSGFGQVIALEPRDRVQPINALVSGRIQEWFVRDGSQIKAGDPILKVIDNDPQLIERLTAEREAMEKQVQAAVTATKTAQLDFERKKRLYEDGLASRLEYENARIKLEDLRAKEAAAAASLNRTDVNLTRQSFQIVRAPRDGTIVSVSAGDTATFVREGQKIATFQPHGGRRAVELHLDGRDAALVEPGRKVRLQFEGWPAVQFSGWPSIAVGTFPGEVYFVDPTALPNGRFRILVVEDPDAELKWPDERFVRYGAQAQGWVLLNKVRVGYELWRQLNNFPPLLQQKNTGSSDNAQ